MSEPDTTTRLPSEWIAERHLRPESIAGYREAYTSHPAHLVHIPDILHPERAEELQEFLANEAVFQTEYSLMNPSGDDYNVNEDQWNRSDERSRFYRFSVFSGVSPDRQLSRNLLAFLKLRTALGDESFRTFFSELTGLALGSLAFAAHSMRQGDFLKPHTDNVRNRRIAFVFYLTKDWCSEFGGDLHVVHHNREITTIAPLYNSLVIFDVRGHQEHVIHPIHESAGDTARRTIGGWYNFPEDVPLP